MNRKSFFKNALGVVASTVIGSKLDFIPEVPDKPGIGSESFTVKLNGPWIDHQMWAFEQEWLKHQELMWWSGGISLGESCSEPV